MSDNRTLRGQVEGNAMEVRPVGKRVTTAQRDRVVSKLDSAMARGALTAEQHDARVKFALEDAELDRDLEGMLQDLPPEPQPAPSRRRLEAVIAVQAGAILSSLLLMIAVPFTIYEMTASRVLTNPGKYAWVSTYHSGLGTLAWVGTLLTGAACLVGTIIYMVAWWEDKVLVGQTRSS